MSGYDNFFKNAKKSKNAAGNSKRPVQTKKEEITAEEYLRSALKVKSKLGQRKKASLPIRALALTVLGFGLATAGVLFPEEVESLYNKVEFMAFSAASAQESSGSAAQNAQTNNLKSADSAVPGKGQASQNCEEVKAFTEEELSHFNKLNERKKELDRRDAELTTLEEELHKQKKEVEARIVKLEQIRNEVASVLKDRVELDQQRVSTLVDFYSNMKPKQAAEIFTTLNEDLAVEVLGKMKKKNAADIMNLLDPTKARALSEKFTGYKRR